MFMLGIMGIADVGIASADMGEDDAVLVCDGLEKRCRGRCVGGDILAVGQERVGRTVDLPAFFAEIDIAVAADPGIVAERLKRSIFNGSDEN